MRISPRLAFAAAVLAIVSVDYAMPPQPPAEQASSNDQHYAPMSNYERGLFAHGNYRKIIIDQPDLIKFYTTALLNDPPVAPDCFVLYIRATEATENLSKNLQGCRKIDLDPPANTKPGKMSAGDTPNFNLRCVAVQAGRILNPWDSVEVGFNIVDALALRKYLEHHDVNADYLPDAAALESSDWCSVAPRPAAPSPGT